MRSGPASLVAPCPLRSPQPNLQIQPRPQPNAPRENVAAESIGGVLVQTVTQLADQVDAQSAAQRRSPPSRRCCDASTICAPPFCRWHRVHRSRRAHSAKRCRCYKLPSLQCAERTLPRLPDAVARRCVRVAARFTAAEAAVFRVASRVHSRNNRRFCRRPSLVASCRFRCTFVRCAAPAASADCSVVCCASPSRVVTTVDPSSRFIRRRLGRKRRLHAAPAFLPSAVHRVVRQ